MKHHSNSNKKKLYKRSRLSILFSFLFISFSIIANPQNVKVSLTVNNRPITEVLEEIEKQTNFLFVYSSDEVNSGIRVSVDADNESITTVLNSLLSNTGIESKIAGNNILLAKKENNTTAINQSGTIITGTVIDYLGDPLPGVNIRIQGIDTGTITDIDGNFILEVPYANATLVFSFVGFQPQEVPLAGRNNVTVELIEDSKALEEVVVVGYTTQRKATITGSVATITTRDLRQSPTANINNALAGRMPGLMVNQFSGGEPGVDVADIRIRGMGTYGDRSPIVIVDGVERDMSYLSAEEIETFTILKDASATAAYGIRGANGVIIVQTKRGQAQEKATVNFKASVGTNHPVKFPKYLGSADYAMLYNEAMINSNPGTDPSSLTLFSEQSIENFRRAKGDNSDGLGYDWDYFDYAFKPGIQQDYSLSVRGGSNQARYFVMANYYNQGGNYNHTNLTQYDTQAVFQRYNFRANVDVDITRNFYVKVDIGARITDRNAPGTTASRVVGIANTQPPYLPITLPNNGHPDNEAYILNNPYGLLYGDPLHRFNILGELSRTGYLNEKKTFLNGSFAMGHKLDFITEGLRAGNSKHGPTDMLITGGMPRSSL